jgi:sugar/nucleoside kinase (ribokinase family)
VATFVILLANTYSPLVTCDVVGLGENSVDLVYRVPALPRAGEKIPVTSCRRLLGGQVATTLCTCAALGLRTRYLGTFGKDEHGTMIRAELEQRGIDTSNAVVRYVPNRHAVILVDEGTGDRSVIWQRDRALALRPEDVPHDALNDARLLHVDNTDEDAAMHAVCLARDAGMMVTTDIDQVSGRTRDLIAAATFPILAEHVPLALTGESDPERALRSLRLGHDGMLCVTLGPRGAMLLAGEEMHHAAPLPIDPVDTTGAGDVFRGALIYALLRGDPPRQMLRFANAAAAVSCTREGAIGGVPNLREIDALLAGT